MTKVHTDRIDQGFVLGNQVLVAEVFAKNGFLVLSSVTGEDKTAGANADQISQGKEDDDSRQIEHPLDHSTRLSQEIVTMRTLLAITYEFLPDEIALQIKATLDLLERGVPTGA